MLAIRKGLTKDEGKDVVVVAEQGRGMAELVVGESEELTGEALLEGA